MKANERRPLRVFLAGLALAASLSAIGCQVEVGGQTIPSPYYMTDDVQYFAPGPEFKLSKEAAALRSAHAEQALTQGR